jgi:hypothetical protein
MKSFTQTIVFVIASLCASCKPNIDINATEKAATEKAATEKAATEKAATEKAATEKAATEKAAIAAEKASVSGEVLLFLQNTNFNIHVGGGDKFYRTASRWLYKNFEYNAADGSLAFDCETSTRHSSTQSSSIGGATGSLTQYRIDLKSANPVLDLKSRSEHPGLLGDTDEPLTDVVIKVKTQQRQLEKKESGGFTLSIFFNKEDYESLNKLPWSEIKDSEIVFTVSPQIGQRLKKAFEDLLRVHGVAVSKY